ncbi:MULTISPECIES: globin domain-containing protein [Streptosporangium]|uniref:nitric oxide dioxygenase n=1 Tax=Streptosporangium brasiliense TaxID=47480 RepID=A0ABT9R0D3_9ACTN|nr:globin domain-containing protein [Streptosporangium brasiliense]MDP9862676.1 nitric oxide dioxygenase [Streptosporangium brasiliense]
MLSPESAATVRATLPVIGGAIENITARFYESMFTDHPELLRNLFNRGNQANGEQRGALAGSIAAFASALVERPGDRPEAMLARIANKHASLGVTPEQYEVVHKYLFAAIAEVLGDAVTPEVAEAWEEVYWLMADALIALEAGLRRDPGEGWLQATVTERRPQTADAVSFTLRPHTPLSFKPGQYVSVAVTLPDGARQIRQYSLSCAPERDDWRITVKWVRGDDTPDGEVSGWLHANVRAGDVLTVSAPFGDLTLPEGDAPLLLASAGIGATPVLSMVDHLAATGSTRRVTVVHADRTPADHAHRDELARLVATLPGATLHRWYEEAGDCSCRPAPNVGHVDLAGIDLPDGLVACLCGPLPFMRAVRSQLLRRGVPASDIHYEVFGPDLWLGRD